MNKNIVEIPLTKGYVAIIDAEDFGLVSSFKWRADVRCGKNPNTYALAHQYDETAKKYIGLLMHRLVTGVSQGLVVDHINHNTLDNRKSNLRICTQKQNARNRTSAKARAKTKGVRHSGKAYKSKPFRADIKLNNKSIYIGNYATVEEAAKAYDAKAVELFGEFAYLNYQAA